MRAPNVSQGDYVLRKGNGSWTDLQSVWRTFLARTSLSRCSTDRRLPRDTLLQDSSSSTKASVDSMSPASLTASSLVPRSSACTAATSARSCVSWSS